MPLRLAAPSLPQPTDSLQRLAKEQPHRPNDFLSEHPHEERKLRTSRGSHAQEADPVREICGAHGEHEITELRNVRIIFGDAGYVWGEEKSGRASPRRPQSFQYQRRSVDDCSPGCGTMSQDGGTRSGTFHCEMDRFPELDNDMQ